MPTSQSVPITTAKGRPMLTWVGKRPLRHVTAFPAQLVEVFDPMARTSAATRRGEAFPPESAVNHDLASDEPSASTASSPGNASPLPQPHDANLLFHGDNKEVLAHLLANGFRGKVKLVYIDPPFDSGADYVRKVSLRGAAGTAKLDGESYTLGEQVQYTDIWANDNYLQFMYERLLLLKELLAEDGSIYLHCDWHKSHHLRCLMDEVFGAENCLNELVWKRTSARSDSRTFNHIHDLILLYAQGDGCIFNQLSTPLEPDYVARYYTYTEPDGRRFATIDATQAGLRSGPSGQPWRGFSPASKGNHWKFALEELNRLDAESRIYWPEKEGGWPRLKRYLDESGGRAIQSIWDDLSTVNSQAAERADYPTQKPMLLVERIIASSSRPGDLILDCFIGSGTTAAVAQKLGRRWIACDINKGAIQTTAKRLMAVIREQIVAAEKAGGQLDLLEAESQSTTSQFTNLSTSFAIYRVNDYDLQIQHNEAVELACEHIGVTRTRNDSFFDGTLGKRLVKIVPFGHPVTPLDLEEVKRELAARPDEARDVAVVALGKEMAVDAWLDDWNRLRKKGDVPNRIEVIELRTDPKYGGFTAHQPAVARVTIERTTDGKIRVAIEDFISPSIIERLKQQANLLNPQIDDWRAMVDSVMIDTAYDGEVFNVTLADVPEKKTDLVAGVYELDAPAGETTVAVKVTDMLGEEVLKITRL